MFARVHTPMHTFPQLSAFTVTYISPSFLSLASTRTPQGKKPLLVLISFHLEQVTGLPHVSRSLKDLSAVEG